jgi:hypothetical protein
MNGATSICVCVLTTAIEVWGLRMKLELSDPVGRTQFRVSTERLSQCC